MIQMNDDYWPNFTTTYHLIHTGVSVIMMIAESRGKGTCTNLQSHIFRKFI